MKPGIGSQQKKALHYSSEIKGKEISKLFKQIKNQTAHIESLMRENVDEQEILPEYKQFMSMYESLLCENKKYCQMLPDDDRQDYLANIWCDRDTYLRNFQTAYAEWGLKNITLRQSATSKYTYHDEDRVSNKSRSSCTSHISLAKIKSEQARAEIEAQISTLKKRQALQRAKLELQMEEDELALSTKLAIEDAKTSVLENLEQTLKQEYEVNPTETSVLNAKAPDFTPGYLGRTQVAVNPSEVNGNNLDMLLPRQPNAARTLNFTDDSNNVKGNSNQQVSGITNLNWSNFNQNYNQQTYGNNNNIETVNNTSAMPIANDISNDGIMLSMVRQMAKPAVEITKFSGEPTGYRKFIRQFNNRVVLNTDTDEERMGFLEQFTCGEANRIVSGFSHLPSEVGYSAALCELEKRYGNSHVIANAYISKALNWPTVRPDNAKALDDFSILLVECENAVKSLEAVRVLEYPDNMKKLVGKLPYYLHDKWRGLVYNVNKKGGIIQFHHLVQFVSEEASKSNDPVYGKLAMASDQKPIVNKSASVKQFRSRNSFATDVVKNGKGNTNRSSNFADKPLSQQNPTSYCVFCDVTSHSLDDCKEASNLPLPKRLEFVKSKRLCYGCLKSGHQSIACRVRLSCSICSFKHPTWLHDESKIRKSQPEAEKPKSDANSVKDVHSSMRAGEGQCAMAIIPVKVKAKNGLQTVVTYAFMDPGSSVSFCSQEIIQQLGLRGKKMSITLNTMGNQFTMATHAIDNLQVCDLDLENEVDLPRVYSKGEMPVSLAQMPTNQDIHHWEHLREINLPEIDAKVGLLIGNNVADAYSPIELRTGTRGSPHAVKSRLGWIIWNLTKSGPDDTIYPVNKVDMVAAQEIEELHNLDRLLRKSFNMDFPERVTDEKREPSQEDKRFLKLVNDNVVHENGRYSIPLPFRSPDAKLPDNKAHALQRLHGLKKKFQRDELYGKDYKEFMSKVLGMGYAEVVPQEDLDRSDGRVWYIPHHGVYHPRKPEKIRVVFDCAAMYLGTSLNRQLLQGPDMTNNLLGVLYRFREEKIALMGDIEAMFFQVLVQKGDTDCLRFLWWPDGDIDSEPQVYRMVVHLFGAASSPSCASYALRQTAKDHGHQFSPEASEAIHRHFYVDDCLVSFADEAEAIGFVDNATALCHTGGFRLTKWVSNSRQVIETVPLEERAKDIKELNLDQEELPNERALGVFWFVESDSLGFKIVLQDRPPTRRGILSLVSSVYDPLGIAAPFVLRVKLLLQDICRRNLEWDQKVEDKDLEEWRKWCFELNELETLRINRCYKPNGFGQVVSCQLHLFSDASNLAYGVVAYLRLVDIKGEVCCSFVTGKARVAPLKTVTIPRLELTAATVAVRLGQTLVKEIDYKIDNTFYWTDSMSVLRYIANESTRFHTFVANRISVIRDASKVEEWKYVDTKRNPADCASRGFHIKKLLNESMWLQGPKFLYESESEWPSATEDTKVIPSDDVEVKHTCAATSTQLNEDVVDKLIYRHSNWHKLRRTLAWVLLVVQKWKQQVRVSKQLQAAINQQVKDEKVADLKSQHHTLKLQRVTDCNKTLKSMCLSLEHIQSAERILAAHGQRKYLPDEIEFLQDSKRVKKGSPLLKLDPFLEDGVLRVGGRLQRANLSTSVKHPVLLPKQSHVSKLILEDAHHSVGHARKNAVLSVVRQQYWIIGASSIIKGLISRCVLCRRYKAPGERQKMADLPAERLVYEEPPFSRVGIDFFGPFEVKRGRSIVKRYGVILTCLSIRAVHLEIAHSLDTYSCIGAIRRFIARRGPPKFIRSDNGTNLVGAEREMREEIQKWNQQKINDVLLQKGISWEFNPPTGSHFGGVWERMIRTIRKILYSLLHQQNIHLDDESLQTLFCEAEAIVNGRPITECPNSPNDLEVLTPNHLLLLRSGESSPPGSFNQKDCYTKRRWRQVQYLADVFWSRWIREFLPLLQARHKWHHPRRNLTIGDIVLIMDSTPRNSWALGRVLGVIKDKQGIVRMVDVKTKTSTLRRPIAKLCLLLESQ